MNVRDIKDYHGLYKHQGHLSIKTITDIMVKKAIRDKIDIADMTVSRLWETGNTSGLLDINFKNIC
jgi:hypothetical protein